MHEGENCRELESGLIRELLHTRLCASTENPALNTSVRHYFIGRKSSYRWRSSPRWDIYRQGCFVTAAARALFTAAATAERWREGGAVRDTNLAHIGAFCFQKRFDRLSSKPLARIGWVRIPGSPPAREWMDIGTSTNPTADTRSVPHTDTHTLSTLGSRAAVRERRPH